MLTHDPIGLTAPEPSLAPSGDWYLFSPDFGFARTFGPVYFRETPDDQLLLGFRCTERHLNPAGACHGGALAAFCDYAALGAQYQLGFSKVVMPTINLSTDFLRGVRPGDWLEGRTEVTAQTGRMCFVSFIVSVDGVPVLSSRGLFKFTSAPQIAGLPFYEECRRLWPRCAARDRQG